MTFPYVNLFPPFLPLNTFALATTYPSNSSYTIHLDTFVRNNKHTNNITSECCKFAFQICHKTVVFLLKTSNKSVDDKVSSFTIYSINVRLWSYEMTFPECFSLFFTPSRAVRFNGFIKIKWADIWCVYSQVNEIFRCLSTTHGYIKVFRIYVSYRIFRSGMSVCTSRKRLRLLKKTLRKYFWSPQTF